MFKLEPKGKDYITKTFRLPEDLVCSLAKLALESNISLNEAVRQALEFSLSQMKEEEG